MSNETMTREEQATAATTDISPAELLDRVVESVRRDCRQDAQLYLEESTVPHGGE